MKSIKPKFVDFDQEEWDVYLPMAISAYNNIYNSSIRMETVRGTFLSCHRSNCMTVEVDSAGATDPTNGFVKEAVGPSRMSLMRQKAQMRASHFKKIMRIVCLIYLFRLGIRSMTSQPIVTLSTSGYIEN